jgi:hypothetical protein
MSHPLSSVIGLSQDGRIGSVLNYETVESAMPKNDDTRPDASVASDFLTVTIGSFHDSDLLRRSKLQHASFLNLNHSGTMPHGAKKLIASCAVPFVGLTPPLDCFRIALVNPAESFMASVLWHRCNISRESGLKPTAIGVFAPSLLT